MIGVVCGMVAAMVGMGSDWANDFKFGLCYGRGFWITREVSLRTAPPPGSEPDPEEDAPSIKREGGRREAESDVGGARGEAVQCNTRERK